MLVPAQRYWVSVSVTKRNWLILGSGPFGIDLDKSSLELLDQFATKVCLLLFDRRSHTEPQQGQIDVLQRGLKAIVAPVPIAIQGHLTVAGDRLQRLDGILDALSTLFRSAGADEVSPTDYFKVPAFGDIRDVSLHVCSSSIKGLLICKRWAMVY